MSAQSNELDDEDHDFKLKSTEEVVEKVVSNNDNVELSSFREESKDEYSSIEFDVNGKYIEVIDFQDLDIKNMLMSKGGNLRTLEVEKRGRTYSLSFHINIKTREELEEAE